MPSNLSLELSHWHKWHCARLKYHMVSTDHILFLFIDNFILILVKPVDTYSIITLVIDESRYFHRCCCPLMMIFIPRVSTQSISIDWRLAYGLLYAKWKVLATLLENLLIFQMKKAMSWNDGFFICFQYILVIIQMYWFCDFMFSWNRWGLLTVTIQRIYQRSSSQLQFVNVSD